MRYHMAFHWHPEHEILYVKKGKLHLKLNQVEYTAVAGDLFFIQGGTFHEGVAEDEAVYYCIVFNPTQMIPQEYAEYERLIELSNNRLHTKQYLGNGASSLLDIALKLVEAFEEKDKIPILLTTGLLIEFMGEMIEHHTDADVLPPSDRSVKTLSAIRNVLYKIETDYASNLTLSELAAIANLSENYFCRLFKKMTSYSPIDYLISYRINIAEYMLKNSDKTITEIALDCGFDDVSHFIKFFKRKKGVTPKQYMLSMHKNS